MTHSSHLAILVAMHSEAHILSKALGLSLSSKGSDPFLTFSSEAHPYSIYSPGTDTNFASFGQPVSMVGKVPMTILATLIATRYHPTAYLNLGTAGGIQTQGVKIGEIIVADRLTFHDIHIPLPGYSNYSVREITVTLPPDLASLPTHHLGLVSTGESFTSSSEDWQALNQSQALAKDMEAASIAQTLNYLGISSPLYVVKSITDTIIEGDLSATSPEEFTQNFDSAMSNLAQFTKSLLPQLLSTH